MNEQILTKTDLEQIFDKLSIDQIRFVIARADTTTDKEAAQIAKLNYNSVRTWPREIKDLVDRATLLMAQDGLVTALHLRRRALARAMAIKLRGLDSLDERIQQGASTEIIEWELGKASQRIDLSGEINVNYQNELERRLSRLAEPKSEDGVPEQPE
jgi:hypothetical protein